MSALGTMSDRLGIFSRCITETDIYPLDVTDDRVVGLSISNTGSLNLEATLTYKDSDKGTADLIVPAGKDFFGTVYELSSIDVTVGDSYIIALFSRGGAV